MIADEVLGFGSNDESPIDTQVVDYSIFEAVQHNRTGRRMGRSVQLAPLLKSRLGAGRSRLSISYFNDPLQSYTTNLYLAHSMLVFYTPSKAILGE